MKKFLMFALAASVISNTSFAASYVIQPEDDTLQGVAYKFGVSYNELMKANPGLDPNSIKHGFRIEIPERTVQNQRVIHIVNPVPKHQPKPQPKVVQNQRVIHIVNPVTKQQPQPKPQPKPQPYAMQHTTPTGPTITIVEEDTVY